MKIKITATAIVDSEFYDNRLSIDQLNQDEGLEAFELLADLNEDNHEASGFKCFAEEVNE